MPRYNEKEPTVWMRSIRYHTYEGHPQPEGAIYLAHEEMVETIADVLKFAVREAAPRRAVVPTPTQPQSGVAHELPPGPAPPVAPVAPVEPTHTIGITSTAQLPTAPTRKRRG